MPSITGSFIEGIVSSLAAKGIFVLAASVYLDDAAIPRSRDSFYQIEIKLAKVERVGIC